MDTIEYVRIFLRILVPTTNHIKNQPITKRKY
nr:MAG TPA: hypothetical protein [Caudoviricetes sp.]